MKNHGLGPAAMNTIRLLWMLVFLSPMTALTGCTSAEGEWLRLDADAFAQAIETEETAFLLDTRTQAEWEQDGYLANATLIPHDALEDREDELPSTKLEYHSNTKNRVSQESCFEIPFSALNLSDILIL